MALPSTYQEVEYIQSNWTQYIDTWLYPSNNIQVETKVEVTTTDQNIPIFWSFMWWSGTDWLWSYYHVTPYNSKFYYWLNWSEWNAWSYSTTLGTQYTIVFNNSNSKLVVNGSEIATTTWTAWYTWTTLWISRRWQWGSARYWKFKYFYFRIYDKTQSKYVRDFVPCYRKSDNVIWLYDLVNDVFYTNAGTGTFTKWPDVVTEIKNIYLWDSIPSEFYVWTTLADEVYIGDVLVWGGNSWWTPWANTVAYIPLRDDLLDHWPNQYTLTNSWWVTIVNDKANIWVWYFNWSSRLLNTSISSWLPLWATAKTISCYVRFNYVSSTQSQEMVWFWRCWWGSSDSANKSFFLFRDKSKRLAFTTWWSSNDKPTNVTIVDNTWYHLLATDDGTTYKIYVNWVLNTSGTLTPNTTGTAIVIGWTIDTRSQYEDYVYWYISDVIIENKAWSSQEIQDYYNLTKWNYWL